MVVHNRLGFACGAGGIQYPQGVVEFDLLEYNSGTILCQCVKVMRVVHSMASIQVRQQDQLLQCWQALAQSGNNSAAVEIPAFVAVTVDCEHDLGRNLLKAIQHAMQAHIRGAAGPDGTNTCAGSERNYCLGDI